MVYAKKVYSFDLGTDADRTEQPHPLGNFDVDFRKPSASNPTARKWTYGGSRHTLKMATKDAEKLENQLSVQTRIVDSVSGKILIDRAKLKRVV